MKINWHHPQMRHNMKMAKKLFRNKYDPHQGEQEKARRRGRADADVLPDSDGDSKPDDTSNEK